MSTVLSQLARVYRKCLCGRQSAARKVQGKSLAHQQGKRVGSVLSRAGEWNKRWFSSLPFSQIPDVGEGGRRPHGKRGQLHHHMQLLKQQCL